MFPHFVGFNFFFFRMRNKEVFLDSKEIWDSVIWLGNSRQSNLDLSNIKNDKRITATRTTDSGRMKSRLARDKTAHRRLGPLTSLHESSQHQLFFLNIKILWPRDQSKDDENQKKTPNLVTRTTVSRVIVRAISNKRPHVPLRVEEV